MALIGTFAFGVLLSFVTQGRLVFGSHSLDRLVPFIGVESGGARRWLGVGELSFQPSEMMKLVVPMTVAWYLASRPMPPRLKYVLASVILMAAVSSGAHVVFPTPQGYRGDGVFDNFWKLIERWKISFIITVPTAISAKMQRPVNADISTVKTAFSGSAPLPVELEYFSGMAKLNGIWVEVTPAD